MSDIMPPMPPLSKVRQPLFVEVRQQLVADLESRYQPGDRLWLAALSRLIPGIAGERCSR